MPHCISGKDGVLDLSAATGLTVSIVCTSIRNKTIPLSLVAAELDITFKSTILLPSHYISATVLSPQALSLGPRTAGSLLIKPYSLILCRKHVIKCQDLKELGLAQPLIDHVILGMMYL